MKTDSDPLNLKKKTHSDLLNQNMELDLLNLNKDSDRLNLSTDSDRLNLSTNSDLLKQSIDSDLLNLNMDSDLLDLKKTDSDLLNLNTDSDLLNLRTEHLVGPVPKQLITSADPVAPPGGGAAPSDWLPVACGRSADSDDGGRAEDRRSSLGWGGSRQTHPSVS